MALKAVAFDVDGTLYPNAAMYWKSVGLAITHFPLLKALDGARKELRDHPDPSDHFHHVQARLVAERLGVEPERAHALIEARIYTRWFGIFSRLRMFHGVNETIDSFRAAGLKVAVLSDFPIRGRLKALGVHGPWDCSFSSEETGYLKPNPEAFVELARKLDLPPNEVLYVGNSYTYDVLGARAAGMLTAHLTKRPHEGSLADLSFRKYSQLHDFVFRRLRDSGYNGSNGRVSS